MKAVLYQYDWWKGPAITFQRWSVDDHIGLLDEGEKLLVHYDNGQLCTFRRKTKGQNNER